MLKNLILALAITMTPLCAAKPTVTRAQIIKICPHSLSVQERTALNQTKTRKQAALMVQSICEDRLAFWQRKYSALQRVAEMGLSREYLERTGSSLQFDLREARDTRTTCEELLAAQITFAESIPDTDKR
jgi:hypothetical protein